MRTVIATLCVALASSGCADEPSTRRNTFERSYAAMAVNQRDPTFCYKIAPDSYTAAGGNPRGLQIYYVRSACLAEVAAFRGDPALCDDVRTLNRPLFLNGSAINAKDCRVAATKGPRPLYFVGGVEEELFLRLLGRLESNEDASIDQILERAGAFLWDSQRLPDFSHGDEAALQQIAELAPQCWNGSQDRLCRLIECAVLRDDEVFHDCHMALDRPTLGRFALRRTWTD